jgi:two-component system response regulator PilR (NtrC family)
LEILVVDDEPSMREYLGLLLTQVGYEVDAASSVQEAKDVLSRRPIDLIISDMKLGTGSGLDVLRFARSAPTSPEVVIITAYGTPAAAVEAMREGAYDYICKPFDNEELTLLVQKALEKRLLLKENLELRNALGGAGGFWVGNSATMRTVWNLVAKVSASRATVLIAGESGTGKELVARAIHLLGARAAQPFIPVNCAALAENLLESELFGHVKGSFTGASVDHTGLLVSAGQGTVFLDEIGEISSATQVKLLRVLQERRVKPVGSSAEVPFEARLLAASNRRLEDEVKAGRFREDLFYRLNVIVIEIPPLRAHPEDIPPLANLFLERAREDLGRPNLRFAPEATALMQTYSFPGNVRQLQNIVERAATLSERDLLGPETLPSSLRGEREVAPRPGELALPEGFSLEHHLDALERRYLLAALERAKGVKTKAAQELGLSFRSFRYRLAKQGLADRDDGEH